MEMDFYFAQPRLPTLWTALSLRIAAGALAALHLAPALQANSVDRMRMEAILMAGSSPG
jgi:hypothetical protein